jgi:hypothetical protein
LSGELVHEEAGERHEEEPWLRWVSQSYAADRVRCVACRLQLMGEQEIEAAGVATEFQKDNLEEAYEEEEYGND